MIIPKKIDPFLSGIALMVLLALIIPYREDYAHFLPLKEIIYFGIMGIFFLYGIKLNPREMASDLSNWRLHLLIQSTTFLLFPILVLTFYPFFKNTEYHHIWLGSFFLAALPSTVSSSVVMVAMGKGNLPSAIFNASISGLIGLIMTPFWMHYFLPKSSESLSQLEIAAQLTIQVLLPVIIGLFFHKKCITFVRKNSSKVVWYDKIIIFLIIYKSFSTAFVDGTFSQLPALLYIIISFACILLFLAGYYFLKWITSTLKFSIEDTITTLFCGSQKSLVHGSVFILVLVNDISIHSLLLIPIMIYHSFQLFFIGYKASVYSKRVK